jgi:peptide chain release factor subunit 1
MPTSDDLRRLSDLQATERSVLSVYWPARKSDEDLEKRITALRKALSSDGEAGEREHFDADVKMLRDYYEKHPLENTSRCIFVCWAADFLEAFDVAVEVQPRVVFDSSPFIRPLAELIEEYEDAAVVLADNSQARVFLVSVAGGEDPVRIKGDVKNHVRKGGWSQQRYERRRDKQLQQYARKIIDGLQELKVRKDFSRLVLLGGREILGAIENELPNPLKERLAGSKAVDLRSGSNEIDEELQALFDAHEQQEDAQLWQNVRGEYLRNGLAVVGAQAVLKSVRRGRAALLVVQRNVKRKGARCRDCDELHLQERETCARCGSESVYPVDAVNELCEMAMRTGADIEFVDPVPTLKQVGGIAARLRY